MAPTVKCPKCKVQFGTGAHIWKCVGCLRTYHAACLGLPGNITNNFESMRLLRESACLICEECKGKMEAVIADGGAVSKRRRDEAGTSASAETEQRIVLLQNQNAELQNHVRDLRRQVTELTQTPPTSARTTDSMNTAQDNLEEPVSQGQFLRLQKEMMNQIRKMFEELKNQRNQRPMTPVRQARPITFAETVRNRTNSDQRQVNENRSASRTRDQSNPPPRPIKKTNRRAQQPLLRYNPAVSTAQAFAISPVELNNRFTVLSTVEDENENFAKSGNRSKVYDRGSANIAQPRRPQLKITGCAVSEINSENLKHGNPWIAGDILIVRHYDVGRDHKKYRNYIIELSLDDHMVALSRKKMIVGFMQCNVHEFVDPIQCKSCWRYGHFRHSCKFSPVCRICGKGTHTDSECDAARDTCINCVRRNKNASETQAKLNTNHRVTDDRCPSRISRNEYVKDFIISQLPRRGGREPNAALNTSLNASQMVVD